MASLYSVTVRDTVPSVPGVFWLTVHNVESSSTSVEIAYLDSD